MSDMDAIYSRELYDAYHGLTGGQPETPRERCYYCTRWATLTVTITPRDDSHPIRIMTCDEHANVWDDRDGTVVTVTVEELG